jgi:hypothetical protein
MAHRTLLRTRRSPAVADPAPPPDGPHRPPVTAAIAFIAAQPFGPDRLLAIHAPLSDGSCRACQARPTRWPCTVAALAHVAKEQAVPTTRAADVRNGARG